MLLKAALLVVTAVHRDQRPVMVHCSDGWDRTPQIVALSKALLDPYYRTIEVSPRAGVRVWPAPAAWLGRGDNSGCFSCLLPCSGSRASRSWWRQSGWTLGTNLPTAAATG